MSGATADVSEFELGLYVRPIGGASCSGRFGFLAALSGSGGCGGEPAGDVSLREAGCAIAMIGTDVVTVADADQVRATLHPPPSTEEARRFAVAVTAAFRARNPTGALPGTLERIRHYRSWLLARGLERPEVFVLAGSARS